MSHKKLSMRALDYTGRRAIIRTDLNVPIEGGRITDDTRIRASLPTIEYVLSHGGAVVLLAHLGRPKGPHDIHLSLKPCRDRLSQLLNREVKMCNSCCGKEAETAAKALKPGEILLFENLRFHEGEEHPHKHPSFVKQLAKFGDLYINDAFGSAHRAHASTATIASFFPGKAAMGLLIEKEIAYLGEALLHPKRPFCAILGGSKVSQKIKVIEVLLKKANTLLIGGAMAYTFFKARGIPIGSSLVEEEFVNYAKQCELSASKSHRLLLPSDSVVAKEIAPYASHHTVSMQQGGGIPDGLMGVDCGRTTIKRFEQEIKQAATIFWNGPLGVFEVPPFDAGTNAIAHCLAKLKGKATTIVGGGDSAAAIAKFGLSSSMSHISTGGGAALEYIEQGRLPGIDALSDAT